MFLITSTATDRAGKQGNFYWGKINIKFKKRKNYWIYNHIIIFKNILDFTYYENLIAMLYPPFWTRKTFLKIGKLRVLNPVGLERGKLFKPFHKWLEQPKIWGKWKPSTQLVKKSWHSGNKLTAKLRMLGLEERWKHLRTIQIVSCRFSSLEMNGCQNSDVLSTKVELERRDWNIVLPTKHYITCLCLFYSASLGSSLRSLEAAKYLPETINYLHVNHQGREQKNYIPGAGVQKGKKSKCSSKITILNFCVSSHLYDAECALKYKISLNIHFVWGRWSEVFELKTKWKVYNTWAIEIIMSTGALFFGELSIY